jgi:peptide deformylase
MSILKVARMGHPVLRERAQALDKSAFRNPLLQKLIDDMIETMHEYHGVGLKKGGKAASASPTSAEWCRATRTSR